MVLKYNYLEVISEGKKFKPLLDISINFITSKRRHVCDQAVTYFVGRNPETRLHQISNKAQAMQSSLKPANYDNS